MQDLHRRPLRLLTTRTVTTNLVALALLLCGGVASSLAAEECISGTWKVLVTADGAQRDYTITVKHEGSSVAGIFRSPRSGEYPFQGGSFDGKRLKIEVPRKMGERTAIYAIDAQRTAAGRFEGKLLIDGNESGTVELSPSGSVLQGIWNVVTRTPQGREYESVLFLVEQEGKLGGRNESRLGTFPIKEVKAEAKSLSFELALPMEGTEVVFQLEAELKDPNTLAGRWKTKEAEFSGDWSATRAAAAPAKEGETEKAAGAAAALAPELAGKWYGLTDRPDGRRVAFQIELASRDGRGTARIEMPAGARDGRDLKADGSKFSFTFDHDEDGQTLQVRIEGKLEDGALRGTWSTQDGYSGDWSASKPVSL